MLFNLENSNSSTNYKLMSQTVIPRPIAWVVTENRKGVINIAPFSYFTPLSSNPPTMLISVGHKSDGTPKDTLQNLRDTKRCVICLTETKDLDKMHLSSKALASNISEADEFNIKTKKLLEDFPPIVEDTPCAYFCTYNQELDISKATIPIILNIKELFIDDRVIKDRDKLEIEFNPIARVGKSYKNLGEELKAPNI